MERKILIRAALLFCALFLNSCNQESLKQLKSLEPIEAKKVTSAQVEYCQSKEVKSKSVGLIIYNIDFSGSNSARSKKTCPPSNPDCDCYAPNAGCTQISDYYEGTDMNHKRLEEIIKHVDGQKNSNAELYFSFVPFGKQSLPSCYNHFNGAAFTKDREQFKALVQNVLDILRTGKNTAGDPEPLSNYIKAECQESTNYINGLSALIEVKKQFYTHLKATYNSNSVLDRVNGFVMGLFLSDGAPIIIENNQFKIQEEKDIIPIVEDFVTQGNASITSETSIQRMVVNLSTAFYTKPLKRISDGGIDPTPSFERNPIDLLSAIAKTGKGQFYDLKANPNYDSFIIPDLVSYFTDNLPFVTLRSAGWNLGSYEVDLDADGIIDSLEDQLELRKEFPDSDNDGYGDYAELIKGGVAAVQTSSNTPCDVSKRDLDTDLDGISDCDESLFGFNPELFDENGNNVPDGVEFLHGLSLKSSQWNVDTDKDGLLNGQEVRLQTPIDYDNRKVSGLIMQQYFIRDSDTPNCKILDIPELVLPEEITEDDELVLETSYISLQDNSKIKEINYLKKTFKRFDKVIIRKDDFKEKFYQEE